MPPSRSTELLARALLAVIGPGPSRTMRMLGDACRDRGDRFRDLVAWGSLFFAPDVAPGPL
ncbi:MAG: hypothetical protein AB7O84_16840 [Planctomycetota bacterium]